MESANNEEAVRQLEQELHVQIVPGTEVMQDVGAHDFIKSSKHPERVLVPQPSTNPHDPLNWNAFWKFSAMGCATVVSFTISMAPLCLAPMFSELIEEFNSDLDGVVQFVGVTILVLGFSNFIWVPISTSFGRRPVYLASNAIVLCSAIWRARAQTYASFMGASILNGIAAGEFFLHFWNGLRHLAFSTMGFGRPAETIQPQVIADVMFLHERGFYQTLYFVAYFGSVMCGPIFSGSMTSYTGWRNFWWLMVAMHAVTLLLCFFGFPETKWARYQNDVIIEASSNSPAQPSDSNSPVIGEKIGGLNQHNTPVDLDLEVSVDPIGSDPHLGSGRPSWQQFKLFQTNKHPWKGILHDLWIPWKLFAFPIVEFASFVVSWSAACFLLINLTSSQVLEGPPYGFSPVAVGLSNFAILVGLLIGLFTAGPLSDWVSSKLTNRNQGVREPEMRLVSMIPYVLIMILGNLVVAYGNEYKWSWKVIIMIGWACAGIQLAALPAIASTYAVDCYKPVAGPIFVSVTINKNLYGYGVSSYLVPWVMKAGYVPPFVTNMSITALWCLFGIVFWFKGKTFRIWTKDSRIHRE